jgi:hypothetical protein
MKCKLIFQLGLYITLYFLIFGDDFVLSDVHFISPESKYANDHIYERKDGHFT